MQAQKIEMYKPRSKSMMISFKQKDLLYKALKQNNCLHEVLNFKTKAILYKFYLNLQDAPNCVGIKVKQIQKIDKCFEKISVTSRKIASIGLLGAAEVNSYHVIFYESAMTYDQMKRLLNYIVTKLGIDLDLEVYKAKDQTFRMINQFKENLELTGLKESHLSDVKFTVENVDKFCVQFLCQDNIYSTVDNLLPPIIIEKAPRKTHGEEFLDILEFIKTTDIQIYRVIEEDQLYFCDTAFKLNKMTFENNTKIWKMLYESDNLSDELKKSIDQLLHETSFKTIYKLIGDSDVCQNKSIKDFIQEDRYYFQNGSFNFLKEQLEPYGLENLYIVRSETEYRQQSCNTIKCYLEKLFTPEQIPYILQYVAAICVNRTYKAAFQLYSQEGNFGKTSFLKLIKQLLNCRYKEIDITDVFQKSPNNDNLFAALENYALLCYINEFDNVTQANISKFKSLVNEDQTARDVMKKYVGVTKFQQFYQFLFDSNQPLQNISRDAAFQTRLFTLEFQTLFISPDDQYLINSLKNLLQVSELDFDKIYDVDELQGTACKRVAFMKRITWTDEDALQLFELIIPYAKSLLSNDDSKLSRQKCTMNQTIQKTFAEFIQENYSITKATEGIKFQQIVDKYIGYKMGPKEYNVNKCIADLQSLKLEQIVISKKQQMVFGLEPIICGIE